LGPSSRTPSFLGYCCERQYCIILGRPGEWVVNISMTARQWESGGNPLEIGGENATDTDDGGNNVMWRKLPKLDSGFKHALPGETEANGEQVCHHLMGNPREGAPSGGKEKKYSCEVVDTKGSYMYIVHKATDDGDARKQEKYSARRRAEDRA